MYDPRRCCRRDAGGRIVCESAWGGFVKRDPPVAIGLLEAMTVDDIYTSGLPSKPRGLNASKVRG